MISIWWNTIIYKPLYNILIFLVGVLPGHNVGLAIILLTVFVKLALYPFTAKSITAQIAMKEIEPELKNIKEKHKDDKKKIAEATMALYQQKGVNPFSGCLPILIQIPVIIGLYWVFRGFYSINTDILYSFIHTPATYSMQFLIFDLKEKSLVLAVLAGVAQHIQTRITLGKNKTIKDVRKENPTFQEDFARNMQMQMLYFLPVFIGFVAYTASAAVALYWVMSSILSILQEVWVRKAKNSHVTLKSS